MEKDNRKIISVVVPCYNEEEALPLFYRELNEVINKIPNVDLELILVNDGSKDKTLDIFRELSLKDKRVKYISFSRNFGKEAAMYAGLKNSTGDYVAIMDADLQDPPKLLIEMYKMLLKNDEYDCIGTRRISRKGEPKIRSFFAKLFYIIMRKISKMNIVDGARDYRLMTRQMTNAIIEIGEYNRFSKGIFTWVGFNTKWIEYENIERAAGKTKWSFWKLFLYSIDGITAFSTFPLVISVIFGLVFCIIAFLMILLIIIKTIVFGDPVSGWPSTICVILLVGGIQLFCTGIIGQYMSKTYLEVKRRPIYIVKEANIENKN